MNLNKLKAEIAELRQHLCADDAHCTCQYVEITEGEPAPAEAQTIITANQNCRKRDDVLHTDYSRIIVAPITRCEELAI